MMHPNALSRPLDQVVRPGFTGTFESMRGRGYVKELEPGRFLVRISITDPLTGKRRQPSRVVHGTRQDAERAGGTHPQIEFMSDVTHPTAGVGIALG